MVLKMCLKNFNMRQFTLELKFGIMNLWLGNGSKKMLKKVVYIRIEN